MKHRILAVLTVLVMIATMLAPIAEAKGFGGRSSGGGGRSSSSSFGGSKSSSSRPSSGSSSSKSSGGWFSSKPKPSSSPATKPSSAGSSSSGYSKPSSKIEQARYKDAVKSGKQFTTRESATSDFKQKYGNQFSSKFTSEPKSRPNYIPSRYRYNGRDVDISFNPSYGGYGYWSGGGPNLGTFLLYDAISDTANAALISSAMSNRGYYVGTAPVNPYGWLWSTLIFVVVLGTIIGVFIWVANR